MKHTPGPWLADRWRVCRVTGNASEFRCICDTASNKASRTPENDANAHLIAAAPELLAACESIVAYAQGVWRDTSDFPPVVIDCMNAIAKAKPTP
jgi:hypothetical protein